MQPGTPAPRPSGPRRSPSVPSPRISWNTGSRDGKWLPASVPAVRQAPAVALEPGLRRARDHAGDAVVVDAAVVPVEQVGEVAEAEAPRAVLDLVVRAGRVAALALDGEDTHLARARVLERHGLTAGDR